jgi:hypothetical protein
VLITAALIQRPPIRAKPGRRGDEGDESELGFTRSEFATVKSRLDNLAGDMAVMKADAGRHGRMLDVLAQDMRMVRGAIDALAGSLPGLEPRRPGAGRSLDTAKRRSASPGSSLTACPVTVKPADHLHAFRHAALTRPVVGEHPSPPGTKRGGGF